MNYFYSTRIEHGTAWLNETESKHALNVFRMRIGDPIWLVDGKGMYYHGTIQDAGSGKCKVGIVEKKEESPAKRPYLHLMIAPTKQSGRFEWFLEKATEIGIDEISPILCEHSERKKFNRQRSERVLIAAMKQSGRATLPRLNELSDLRPVLERTGRDHFLAVAQYGGTPLVKELSDITRSVAIFIGPEGDFSRKELDMFRQQGAKTIGLGSYRLRTETAGVVAAALINGA